MDHVPRTNTTRFLAIGVVAVAVLSGLFVVRPQVGDQPHILTIDRLGEPIKLINYLYQRETRTGPFVEIRSSSERGRVIEFTVSTAALTERERCEVHWTQRDQNRRRIPEEYRWRYGDALGWPDGLLLLDEE